MAGMWPQAGDLPSSCIYSEGSLFLAPSNDCGQKGGEAGRILFKTARNMLIGGVSRYSWPVNPRELACEHRVAVHKLKHKRLKRQKTTYIRKQSFNIKAYQATFSVNTQGLHEWRGHQERFLYSSTFARIHPAGPRIVRDMTPNTNTDSCKNNE